MDLGKHPPPASGEQKREKALEHQNEGHGQPEGVAVQVYFFKFYFLAGVAAALPRNTLKNSEDEGSTTITSLFLLKLAL